MEDASALIHLELFLLLSIPILVSSSNARTSTTIATAPPQPRRLVMKLIHRDSLLSPYYNPNASISERVRWDMKSSTAPFSYLKSRTKSSSTTDDIRGGVIPVHGGSLFVVNISIGQPPVPQLVAMDTGSDLLWIQCRSCTQCYKQISPMFDPSKSSTFRFLQCNSPYCGSSCDSKRHCPYDLQYADSTRTSGILGIEKLRLLTSDEGTTSVPDIIFGCGRENFGLGGQVSGILGLGAQELSLVSQIGSKFSYCIGNIYDPHYEYNQLIIGDGAKIEGYSTPMEVFNRHYHITLEGISVGEKRLNIDPQTFRRSPTGYGGVIIDSGSTVIHLHKGGLDPLREEVTSLIGAQLRKETHPNQPDWLCYKGMVNQDLKGFPVVTFHFAGGADLVVEVDAMFEQTYPNMLCMAVVPPAFQNLTIIGIRAQQYYNVAYDLDVMKLYLQRIDCQLLED